MKFFFRFFEPGLGRIAKKNIGCIEELSPPHSTEFLSSVGLFVSKNECSLNFTKQLIAKTRRAGPARLAKGAKPDLPQPMTDLYSQCIIVASKYNRSAWCRRIAFRIYESLETSDILFISSISRLCNIF